MITLPAEEVFTEIPNDPDNVLLNLPPEIIDKLDWKDGDTLTITVEDGKIIIKRKADDKET